MLGTDVSALINFRGDLIKAIENEKYHVMAFASLTNDQSKLNKLSEAGIEYYSYPVQRTGLNPFADLYTFFFLRSLFKDQKPHVVFAYTIKPIVWSGIALLGLKGVRFFALIEGLGYTMSAENLLAKLVRFLYRVSLRNAERVIFLNKESANYFIEHKMIDSSKVSFIPGIGVNIETYIQQPFELPFSDRPIFLVISRLLRSKGFYEYFEAAKIVKQKYPNVKIQWLGSVDTSPDRVLESDLKSMNESGVVEYLGDTDDVRPFLQKCHILVHPSYYPEGMPRSILEAMATGRPILTTDTPGCRDTVIPGENGFLVPKANAEALAERMIWLIENPDSWQAMGLASRKLAEERFDVHKVNTQMLRIMGLK